ncbi:MAG: RnfABCDGE type electron transport complex subunit G [Romboutsia sp.]
MNNIVKLGAILFGICAVAALALGFTNNITAPIIADRNIQANNEARQIVLKDATEFKQMDDSVFKGNELVNEMYEGINGSDVVGYTIKTLPKGYGGQIELIVGISIDGNVTGINMGSMSETPGLGSKAAEPIFKEQFNEKPAEKFSLVKGDTSADNEIQAISGATITSTAVTEGVNAAIEVYNSFLKK